MVEKLVAWPKCSRRGSGMMAVCRVFLLSIGLVSLFGVCLAETSETVTSLVDVIPPKDHARLIRAFQAAEPYHDLRTAYLIIRALKSLGFSDADKSLRKNACTYVDSNRSTDLKDVYYTAAVMNMLKDTKEDCKIKLSSEEEQVVRDAFKGEPSVENLFYAISTTAYTGKKIDNTTVPQQLMAALENDDTPLSYGRAFHAAALIPDADLSDLFDQIEDIVAQADETPTTLYYDGGIKVTSMVVCGIFALSAHTGNAPALTEAQATKFGNYFLSSKYTTVLDNLSYMLAAASALANNKFVVPSSLRVLSSQPISQTNQNLIVELTDILGRSVGPFDVRVRSITDSEGTETKRDKAMSPGDDKKAFTYPIFNDLVDPGIYTVLLSTEAKKSTAVVSLPSVEVQIAFSYEVTVGDAQLLLKDRDQDVTTKSVSLSYPNTNQDSLEVDQHTRVVMTFSLVNKNKKTKKVQVHQAFVRFSAKDKEIFYVTKYNSDTKDYSFELDVREAAADFVSHSGSYVMTLIVGDFAIENPFSWQVATIQFKFPSAPVSESVDPYSKLPVIIHEFRDPEKRPPVVISTTFTILALLPLAVLFILWIALGANISNISAGGIWTIFFHLGLGAILALFYCFWLQLNMFQTLKYLAGLGAFTFLTGNRMLRNIAKSKQV